MRSYNMHTLSVETRGNCSSLEATRYVYPHVNALAADDVHTDAH